MSFFKGFASKFKMCMHIIDFDHVLINQCTVSKKKKKTTTTTNKQKNINTLCFQ